MTESNVTGSDMSGKSTLPQDIARATKRPDHITAPAHWTSEPAPEPENGALASSETSETSPTRYGDWVYKGIAIDFS